MSEIFKLSERLEMIEGMLKEQRGENGGSK